MKKIFTILSIVALGVSANAQTAAFNGSDFETWSDFTNSITSFGIKSYATQGLTKGYNGTSSLNITGTPTGNDYVFTVKPTAATYPSSIGSITFWVKGTSGKSLSFNVYMANGTNYNVFNLKDFTTSATITPTAIQATGSNAGNGSNDYIGVINTGGAWQKVTLDMSTITSVNVADKDKNFFALKVGKDVSYALDIDDVKVVSSTMGTIDVKEFDKKVKMNTLVSDNLTLIELPSKSTVNIYSVDGKLVSSNRVNSGESINVSKLQKGNYIVTVEDGTNKVSRKIVKK